MNTGSNHQRYILYWMQQAQRYHDNPALNKAIRLANETGSPLLVCFVLAPTFPEGNLRNYRFMLEGLLSLRSIFQKHHIPFIIRMGHPVEVINELSLQASKVVTDRGYLRYQRQWRETLRQTIRVPLLEIETDAVVPVSAVSHHEEYAARTLRPKILRVLHEHLQPELIPALHNMNPLAVKYGGREDTWDIPDFLNHCNIPLHPGPSPHLTGGHEQALLHLEKFLTQTLPQWDTHHDHPDKQIESNLSPYLHFGQISARDIARMVLQSRNRESNETAFLEQLIVRRELSFNFCFYQDHYDQYDCIPDWAKRTLEEHRNDARPHIYSREALENAETHDPYWNAAQREMLLTGKMHGYMRMYWGKKLVEWIPDPETAFHTALELNNLYELDGRDPNAFAGVAWCFGKHDRPFSPQPVFGTVRSMTANGLKRKFDMPAYLKRIETL